MLVLLWSDSNVSSRKIRYVDVRVDIAQSATDTTEGVDKDSHGLQALARWQQSLILRD